MSFLNPYIFAAGVAGLALPIIVHLQRRRRRVRVMFSSLRLVEESQRITRKRLKITDWPILLLRLLAVALLAFAFGRPWLQSLAGTASGQKESLAIVLDQSASMHAKGEVGPVWDEAIDAIRRALNATHSDSRVTLITSPMDANVSQTEWKSPRQVLGLLSDLKPGFGRADLAAALNRAGSSVARLENDRPKVVHLISDLQQDAVRNLDRVTLPSNVAVRVTKVGDLSPFNVGLTASVVGEGELRRGVYSLQIPESGSTSLGSVTIQDFDGSGQPVGDPVDVKIKPNSLSVAQAYAAGKQGWYSRKVKLNQEDALAIDNEVVDAFYVQDRVDVLLIEPNIRLESFNQRTFFFSRALDPFLGEADKTKRPTRFSPKTVPLKSAVPEIQRLEAESSVVFLPALKTPSKKLAMALSKFVAEGGGLLLFSGKNVNPETYEARFADMLPVKIGPSESVTSRATLEYISERHPLWGGLDLSNRQRMIRLPIFRRSQTELKSDAIPLARFSDGEVLVAQKMHGSGRVIFVNTTARREWTDWPTMGGSYVPTIHVLAAKALPDQEGSQRNADVQRTYHESLAFNLGADFAEQTFQIDDETVTADPDGNIEKKTLAAPVAYSVQHDEHAMEDGQIVRKFAVNLDPRESNLESTQSVIVKRQLESQRTQGSDVITTASNERNDELIWKSLLAVLAIILAIEPFLANLA